MSDEILGIDMTIYRIKLVKVERARVGKLLSRNGRWVLDRKCKTKLQRRIDEWPVSYIWGC